MRTVSTLYVLLALAGCASGGGSSRECSFARPLVLSRQSITAMDPADRRELLIQQRTTREVCK